MPPALAATYRRRGQRGPAARALLRADLSNPRSVLEGLVGEIVHFNIECPREPRPDQEETEAPARGSAPAPELPAGLPPIAAALAAEAGLLAALSPYERRPDMLGMVRVIKLMTLAAEHAGPERAAAA